MAIEPARLELLSALARKVLWLSSWTIHHANHIRPNADKVSRRAGSIAMACLQPFGDNSILVLWRLRKFSNFGAILKNIGIFYQLRSHFNHSSQ